MSHFVIRPGETEYDVQSRITGQLSLPLTAKGRLQVGHIIDRLKGIELDAVYTAGTEPALSTAISVADALDTDVKVLEGLMNMNLGLWQGLRLDDLKQRQPRVYKLWREAPEAVCPPLGETCDEAYARIEAALRKPMRRGVPFAVVCPEPAASIVACILRNCPDQLPGPLCGCSENLRVEEIRLPVVTV